MKKWIAFFLAALILLSVTACGSDGENLRVTINDSYEEDALTLDIWLNAENAPIRAEILYDGRRIVTMDIENFTIS